jgi:hypothetical protein
LCRSAPLFLQELELIHSKQDTLQFRAFIQVLEVHDFSIPGVDISEDSSSESDADDYPWFDPGRGSGLHRSWPRVFHHVAGVSSSREAWPTLLLGGGGASWCQAGLQSRHNHAARTVRARQGSEGSRRVIRPSRPYRSLSPVWTMHGSVSQDLAGSPQDVAHHVKTTATVQASDRWLQVPSDSQLAICVLEREKVGDATSRWT